MLGAAGKGRKEIAPEHLFSAPEKISSCPMVEVLDLNPSLSCFQLLLMLLLPSSFHSFIHACIHSLVHFLELHRE